MDFSSILSYLQNLLTSKQGQQATEFGQNLGLQQSQLAQQGQEFNSNLGLQTQAEKDAAANAAGQLGLGTQTEKDTAAQAAAQLAVQKQAQQFAQQLAMQNFLRSVTGGAGGSGGFKSSITPMFPGTTQTTLKPVGIPSWDAQDFANTNFPS